MQTKILTYSKIYNQTQGFFDIISDKGRVKTLIEDINADKAIHIEIERFIYQTNFYPDLEAKLQSQRVELARVNDYALRAKLHGQIDETENEVRKYKIGILETLAILYNLKEENLPEVKGAFFMGNIKYANSLLNSNSLLQAQSILLDKLGIEQKLEEVYEKLIDNANEYQVKAQLTSLNLEIAKPEDRLQKTIEFFKKGKISAERSKRESFVVTYCISYAFYLQLNNLFDEANEIYQETLKKGRLLAKANPDEYLLDVAITLTNLSILNRDKNNLDQSERECREALVIYRTLADKNPVMYIADVGINLNNLGHLHYAKNELDQAEEEFREALEIYRSLAEAMPSLYLSYLGGTLNNLAAAHSAKNELIQSEKDYLEALAIYRLLARSEPSVHLPNVAITLNNLAVLHSNINKLVESENEYQEALAIRRSLAADNPSMYLPFVATTLNNLANLHIATNRLVEAENECREALTLRRSLAAANPFVYLPHVATTVHNLGYLHTLTNELEEAEKEYLEALEIRRSFADISPERYLPDLIMTLVGLAFFYSESKPDKAISLRYVKEAIISLAPFLDIAPYMHKYADRIMEILEYWGVTLDDLAREGM